MDRKAWFGVAQANSRIASGGLWKESETRRLIIEPALAAAGYEVWNASSPDRIIAEDTVEGASKAGGIGRCDYVTLVAGNVLIAIEAKPAGARLNDADAKQVCDYCTYRNPRLRWGILTNGIEWRVYDNSLDGSPDKRRVLDWRLDEERTASLVRLLGPDYVSKLETLVDAVTKVPTFRMAIVSETLRSLPDWDTSPASADSADRKRLPASSRTVEEAAATIQTSLVDTGNKTVRPVESLSATPDRLDRAAPFFYVDRRGKLVMRAAGRTNNTYEHRVPKAHYDLIVRKIFRLAGLQKEFLSADLQDRREMPVHEPLLIMKLLVCRDLVHQIARGRYSLKETDTFVSKAGSLWGELPRENT